MSHFLPGHAELGDTVAEIIIDISLSDTIQSDNNYNLVEELKKVNQKYDGGLFCVQISPGDSSAI